MTIQITNTPVNGDYYARRYLNPCTGAMVYTNWTVFDYNKLSVADRLAEHRVKPSPLTDTALERQYKLRIKPSEIPFDDLAIGQSSMLCGSRKYYTVYERKQGIGVSSTSTVPVILPTVDWESRLYQHVRSEFVTIGDSLAEYRATAKMFKQYAQGMYSTAKKLRDLKKFRTSMSFCTVPLAELAYSFGVAPLVEDTFSTAEALRLRLQNPIYKDYHNTSNGYVMDRPTWSGYYDVQRRSRVSIRVNARYELKPFESVITISNPVSWAWELIPFSFVVDWGIPIGQWLLDIDAIRLMEGIKGTRTVKRNYSQYFRIGSNNRFGVLVKGSLGSSKLKDHQRFLLTSLPLPPFPRWKPSLSWHKVYRAITLLVAVRGCKPIVRRPRKGPWWKYKDFYGRRS